MRRNEETETEDRERSIVEALRRIIRAVGLHSRKLAEEHGLTAPQLAALQEIQRRGAPSAGDVARRIHLSPGTVTGILTRLEQRGLVSREPGATDRRRVEIRPTALGLQVLDRAPSLLQDRFRHSLARLQDWEQQMLLAALQRIAAMMNAGDLDASPFLTIGDVDSSPQRSQTVTDDIPVGEDL